MNKPISVIIPTLDEADQLPVAIASADPGAAVEVVVADGGSSDRTVEIAQSMAVKLVRSTAGKAYQMNAGAREASGDILVFLHADTVLPKRFDLHVRQILSLPGVVAGAFRLRIDDCNHWLRIIEKVATWRSIHLQLPYGDQAIFMRAATFRAIGGFPDLPIMEDFEIIRRLRKRGRIAIAPLAALTSARRWQRQGVWRTTLLNQLLIFSYFIGVAPITLARWYGINNRRF